MNDEQSEPEKEENKEDNQNVKKESEEEKKEPSTEEKVKQLLRGKNKEGSFKPIIFVMIASLIVAAFWDKASFIKNSVHAILDPSAGILLNWDLTWGMMLIIFCISLFTTLVQKYATDQEALRELRKEQKLLQKKSQEFRDNPEKMMEIQKEIMPLTMKTMKLSMRAVMFTGIPFILFFRWFNDFFANFEGFRFFGFFSWYWFYLIFIMIFSSILRKVLKVV